jgi:Carbohydrate binding domain
MSQPCTRQVLVEHIAARRNIMPQSSRRFLIPLAVFFVIGSLGTLFLVQNRVPNAHAATNLVNNSGFETGNLNGWTCDPTNIVVTSPVHSGSYALQLTPTSSTTGQCTQTVSVQSNTTYTLSAYVNGSYAYIGVNGYSTAWTNSSGYTQLTSSFTTDASTTSITIYLHDWYSQANDYVDDVLLTGPAGSATPTPMPTATTNPSTATPTATPMPNTPVPTATPKPNTPVPTSTPGGNLVPVVVTFYSDIGLMADGQPTHLGACAALTTQYAFGTMIQLYDPQNLNTIQYSCTIEDTGVHICQDNIDVSLPGQTDLAIQLGVKHWLLKVVGFDQNVANEAAANHPSSPGCSGGPTH